MLEISNTRALLFLMLRQYSAPLPSSCWEPSPAFRDIFGKNLIPPTYGCSEAWSTAIPLCSLKCEFGIAWTMILCTFPVACLLQYQLYTLYIYISQANWIISSSSSCNQGLLDDSMQLQLIHTVHHSYHWLQNSQFPGQKWFLCCFNSSWIYLKDIFCVIVQYSELEFLSGNLHSVKWWTWSDTAILKSLIFF